MTHRIAGLGAALALLVAACSAPQIDPAVAEGLAARAEEVAARLEAGDRCGADELADRLDAEAGRAVADGAVPEETASELVAVTRRLAEQVDCPPPPPPPRPDEDKDDEEKDEDKEKDEKKDEDEDEEEDGEGNGNGGSGEGNGPPGPGRGRGRG